MKKPVIIVVAVVLVGLSGLLGYWLYSQFSSATKSVEQLNETVKKKDEEIKTLGDLVASYKVSIDALKAEIEVLKEKEKASEEEKKSPYFGWKTYTDTGLGIKFMYPPTFTIIRQGDGLGVYTTISDVLGNNTYEIQKSEIINFSTSDVYVGLEPRKPNKDEPAGINVDGKFYAFSVTSMSEGFGTYVGGSVYYTAKLKTNLFTNLMKTSQQIMKYNCSQLTYPYELEGLNNIQDCEEFNYSVLETKFETSKEDLDKGILLLQSIKYL